MDKFNNSEFQHSVNAFSSSYDDDSQVSDDSSSSSDESSHSKSTANAANEVKEMARHETNAIRRWRLITLTVILLTGALVATGSFLYLKNQEDKDATDSVSMTTSLVDAFTILVVWPCGPICLEKPIELKAQVQFLFVLYSNISNSYSRVPTVYSTSSLRTQSRARPIVSSEKCKFRSMTWLNPLLLPP